MRRTKITRIDPEVQARNAFSAHVQSIAFNLTLSRRMIDLLRLVRDYGFPHFGHTYETKGTEAEWAEWRTARNVLTIDGGRMGQRDAFVTFMHSLERRGLVVTNPIEWEKREKGDPAFLLSRAGELVCDLLVEARLMPSQDEAPKWMSQKRAVGR